MKNTTYERPKAPDMLPNGAPNITTFRTSRTRQVSYMQPDRTTEPVIQRRRLRPGKRTFFVIAGALIILGMFVFWQQEVVPWWVGMQDQWNYGSTRITQLDANVGHGGESHFIAEYSKGSIIVIEISYTNPNDTHIYTLSDMASSAAQPVVLLGTARDVQTGRVDLTIQVEGTSFQTVLYNTGSTFSETQP